MSQKSFFKSRLFKLPNHRRFEFSARYYDEDKERIEKRKKEIKNDLAKNYDNDYSERIKDSFNRRQPKKGLGFSSWENTRLIIIFVLLIAGFFFLYDELDELLEYLTQSKK